MTPGVQSILEELGRRASPRAVAGMARYGIRPRHVLGVSMPFLRQMGRRLGTDHDLALGLWRTGVHEAKILATLVADPARMDRRRATLWLQDCDSWDIVDQCCGNLFVRMNGAIENSQFWSKSRSEFVKRGGFALMARLAVHDKHLPDRAFLRFLPAISRGAYDDRNLVKKAVNWALRQIGKRNRTLHRRAFRVACRLAASPVASVRWVGSDALRELARADVLHRLKE